MTKQLLAFDVNETLLDLAALDPLFIEVFGDASPRPVWFQTMLQIAFVGGITGHYVDFTSAQHAALEMVAHRLNRAITSSQSDRIVEGMKSLPAHPEVPSALRSLRTAGFRQVTITNSTLEVARAQVEFAGIADLFDDILSADDVRHLKPAPEAYRHVATRTGTALADIRLVAAHAWDVSGALAAGTSAAFIARNGAWPSPIGSQPDIVATDLTELARKLQADD